MKKLAYVTNIPTPYRDFRFKLLSEELLRNDVELEVLYMANSEPGRKWDTEKLRKGYASKVFFNIGLNITRSRRFLHFNPGLLFYISKCKFDYVVVGGISSPTHILAPLFSKKSKKTILSVESNISSESKKSKFYAYLKNKVIARYRYFQVTGNPSVDYIKQYTSLELNEKNVYYLKNLINESDFKGDHYSTTYTAVRSSKKIEIVCVCRLEKVKGILDFLEGLSRTDHSRLHIKIVGDGSLMSEIREFVRLNNLPVSLMGHVDSSQIVNVLSKSDVFLLPSISDPSPLSPIEALFLGKPLLVSDRLGNVDDVLDRGVNGFSFDVLDPNSIVDAINSISSLSFDDINILGRKSYDIYMSRFDPELLVSDYVKSILG